MRAISGSTITKLTQKLGTEPVYVVEVQWSGGLYRYSDRAIPDSGIEGRILDLGSIQDVVSVNKSTSTQSAQLTLSDTDGVLKEIFNSSDIHKRPVWIYQWFTGIPYSDKVLLFKGQVSSPIVWRESERTLSFDVASLVESLEVGFSPDEGEFPNLPPSLVGKTWPMVFGQVFRLPGILVDAISSGSRGSTLGDNVLKEPFGIEDPTLESEIEKNESTRQFASDAARLYFIGYLAASSRARREGELDEFDNIREGQGPWSSLAIQYLDLGNQMLLEAQKVNLHNGELKGALGAQQEYNKATINVTNGRKYQANKRVKVKIGAADASGYFVGDQFHVEESSHPNAGIADGLDTVVRDYKGDPRAVPVIARDNFFFADAGTRIFVYSSVATVADPSDAEPIRFVLSAGTFVTVTAAYAEREVGGITQLTPVPPSYYQVYNLMFGTVPVTVVYLPQPLSTRVGPGSVSEGWDNTMYFDCFSGIGPNVVDIIAYLVSNFTNLSVDSASFGQVRSFVDPFPANFALTSSVDAYKLIQDVAYQAKCAVWISNDVVHIKYLAHQDAAVDTISESDLIFGSVEVTTTETEDIITKYVAEWQPDYYQNNVYKLILRYNISQYGLREKSFSYFIYNVEAHVFWAAAFWLIRSSHTYKRIRFRTPLSKIRLEPFDTILLNFTSRYVANVPVVGLIEQANIDSQNFEVDFLVWVPVILGEMVPFDFAFPSDLAVQRIFPRPEDVQASRPGSAGPGRGAKLPAVLPPGAPADLGKAFTGDTSGLHVSYRDFWDWPEFQGGDEDFKQPPSPYGTAIDSTSIVPTGPPPTQTTKYQYKNFDLAAAITPEPAAANNVFPATVQGGGDGSYVCKIYKKGEENEPEEIEGVKMIGLNDEDDPVPPGTPCFVIKLNFVKDKQDFTEYYMQVPVWTETVEDEG